MKIKIIALLAVISIMAGIFAGCQSSELREYPGEPEPSSGEADQPASGENTRLDFAPVFEAYEPDTVMMTINGIDVTWRELFYWYYYEVSVLINYVGGMPVWDEICFMDSTKTYEEYVKDTALETIKHYCALESKASDMGIELTEEDQAELESRWQSSVESYGGGDEAAFKEYLEQLFLSEDMFRHINTINVLYRRLQTETYGEKGEKLDEAEILDEAESQGYMRAKHILFSINDDSGNALSDEEKAAKCAEAEETLAELLAIEDPAALEARFDELITEKSADGGSAYYPDGYTFLPGKMVESFETAVKELEPGKMSPELVESVHGYHIILRLPLDTQAVTEIANDGSGYTLSQIIAESLFTSLTSAWAEESEVVFTKEYEEMDLAAVFDKVETVPVTEN